MKYLVSLIIIIQFCFTSKLVGQCNGTIVLETQAEVDAFGTHL